MEGGVTSKKKKYKSVQMEIHTHGLSFFFFLYRQKILAEVVCCSFN